MSEAPAFTRIRRLGTGAAGEVWLAEGKSGLVALKIAAAGRSLAGEVRGLRRIAHPNVPALIEADPDGRWMVRAYAEGQRLTSWSHGREIAEVTTTFALLADAVNAIHAAGVLHGDLSPANVLVDVEGRPHVLDLGADLRGPGGALGWMAPERLRGEDATVASDVYSLGALLYAMTTGRPPYDRSTGTQLGWAAATSLPVPPSSLRSPIPSGLESLILDALAWTPQSRPSSAGTMAERAAGARETPALPPVVGMGDERERLRRAVIEALRGEGGLYVVHGPPGSGRRTLMAEVARAARREALPVVEAPLSGASAALLASRESGVLLLDADDLGPDDIATALDRPTDAALILVRARRPVQALGRRAAVHLGLPRISVDDIALLLRAHGRDDVAPDDLWTRTRGLAGAVACVLAGGDLSPHPPAGPEALILNRLRVGPAGLPELATVSGLREHRVLDLLEPWMIRGAVWSSEDGATLAADLRGLPALRG